MYSKQQVINKMNTWGGQKKPFLFIIDYELQKPLLYALDELPSHIDFDLNGLKSKTFEEIEKQPFTFETTPILFNNYKKAFDKVVEELNYGNSYLLNLTFPTSILTNLSLKTIFKRSVARYKLLVDSQFVVFSPETFIKIEDGVISSYPMKGTIDASIPNAEQILLNDPKEKAEHATIVDLIRNDLSKVASHVRVTKYRYVEKIDTFKKPLLQVSSQIVGKLPLNYENNLGAIIFALLPAGSISGAPKTKTIEIIRNNEIGKRGYFSGIVGIFDGNKLDSGVMIRFIEQHKNKMTFRSGGGITAQSKATTEYQELLDKVYVPFN